MSLNVRKGDKVLVIAGKDIGKSGKVISVNTKTSRVTVDGISVVTKHVKARSAQAVGGIEKANGTLDVSNVQVICPVCDKATRVANTIMDGKKVRSCKKCGAALDVKEAKAAEKKEKKAKSTKKADDATSVEEKTPAKKTTAKKSTKKADESSEA